MLETIGPGEAVSFSVMAQRLALLEVGHDAHRHHLVCTQCTRIVEIGECIVRELEERVISRSKFKAVTHRLEFLASVPPAIEKPRKLRGLIGCW